MKKPFRILLILVTAVMLFASGYAYADTSEELIYDENDNTWAAVDEDLTELVGIMKRECAKSSQIKGTYILSEKETEDKEKLRLEAAGDCQKTF